MLPQSSKPRFLHIAQDRVRLAPDGSRWEVYNPLVRDWLDAALYSAVQRADRAARGRTARSQHERERKLNGTVVPTV